MSDAPVVVRKGRGFTSAPSGVLRGFAVEAAVAAASLGDHGHAWSSGGAAAGPSEKRQYRRRHSVEEEVGELAGKGQHFEPQQPAGDSGHARGSGGEAARKGEGHAAERRSSHAAAVRHDGQEEPRSSLRDGARDDARHGRPSRRGLSDDADDASGGRGRDARGSGDNAGGDGPHRGHRRRRQSEDDLMEEERPLPRKRERDPSRSRGRTAQQARELLSADPALAGRLQLPGTAGPRRHERGERRSPSRSRSRSPLRRRQDRRSLSRSRSRSRGGSPSRGHAHPPDHGAGGHVAPPHRSGGYDPDRPGKRLYVGRLPTPVTEKEIADAISGAIRGRLQRGVPSRPSVVAADAALEQPPAPDAQEADVAPSPSSPAEAADSPASPGGTRAGNGAAPEPLAGGAGDRIVTCVELNSSKGYAFVDCCSIEAADAGVELDGSIALHGVPLKIGRPMRYEAWARATGHTAPPPARQRDARAGYGLRDAEGSSGPAPQHDREQREGGGPSGAEHAQARPQQSAVRGGGEWGHGGAQYDSRAPYDGRGPAADSRLARRGGRWSDRAPAPTEMESRRNRDWDMYAAPDGDEQATGSADGEAGGAAAADAGSSGEAAAAQMSANAASFAYAAVGLDAGEGAGSSGSASSTSAQPQQPGGPFRPSAGAQPPPSTMPSSEFSGSSNQMGGIALSNTRKNAMLVQGAASASVMTASSLAALRERILASTRGALPDGASQEGAGLPGPGAAPPSSSPPASAQPMWDAPEPQQQLGGLSGASSGQQLQQSGVSGGAEPALRAPTAAAATDGSGGAWSPVEEAPAAPPPPPLPAGSEAAGSVSAPPLPSQAAVFGPFQLAPGCPLPTQTAHHAPLLGMSSTVSSYTQPCGSGSVNLGPAPAATAGLLGPGGLMMYLAGVQPTRILVVLNALSDAEIAAPAERADILADLVIEACAAVQPAALLGSALAAGMPPPTAPAGRLLAVRVPLPKSGESVDPDMIRRGRLAGGVTANSGATLAIEDARVGDRSSTVPRSAQEFFDRVIKLEYGGAQAGTVSGAMGLLTDAPALGGAAHAAAAAAAAAGAGALQQVPHLAGSTSTALTLSGDPSAAPPPPEVDPLEGRTRGLGKVFLEFSTSEAAVAAQRELSGRAFSGRILVTSFVEEDAYRSGEACDFAACAPEPWAATALQ